MKNTSAGTTLAIGAPFTTAAAALTDMTYQVIGSISNLGEFGKQFQEITFSAIDTREVEKFKGTVDHGAMALQLGQDLDDDGQTDLEAAVDSDDAFNFRVQLNDKPTPAASQPTSYYFPARAMSAKTNVGGPNQVVGLNTSLSITGAVVRVAKVTGP